MPTHTNKQKTHQGMPKGHAKRDTCPQSPALESLILKGETKTAGCVPCQEESKSQDLPSHPLQNGKKGLVTVPPTPNTEKKKGTARVFVISKNKTPLMPCHPARARELLRKGKAVVHRLYPFVIRLKERTTGDTQPVELKLDPGSKTTGLALVTKKNILFLAQILHRGREISNSLKQRSNYRRRRRGANLRRRPARFLNRRKHKGWLPPSTMSIINNIANWEKRFAKWVPITGITIEHAKFDTQKMQNPEIGSDEYQKGTLAGWEVWEYLLAKFNHRCFYCEGKSGDNKLTQDHVIPVSQGGSNRVSNLVVACNTCNQKKGSLSINVFLAKEPAKLKSLENQLKTPLHDAARINSLRNGLVENLTSIGLQVTLSTGAKTKFNRQNHNIPKRHALDAAFTGEVETTRNWQQPVLNIKAQGRGKYQRTITDRFGFPKSFLPRKKRHYGFQTGDFVSTPRGIGRICVRTTGQFSLNRQFSITHKKCRLLQRGDGYNYFIQCN